MGRKWNMKWKLELDRALWGLNLLGRMGILGYCPHPVTFYDKATIKGNRYISYYPTATGWGRYPRDTIALSRE